MNFFLFRAPKSILLFVVYLIVLTSCNHKNEIIKTEYPKLADAITERNFDELWEFINHENDHVRALAWKAIAKSETDDLSGFIDFAVQEDDPLSWYALSLHPLSGEQVNMLNEQFSEGNIQSESVCEAFFRKGNLNTLNLLLDKSELVSQSEMCSQAVGGILSRIQVDDITRRSVFDMAFNSGNETIWRNLLYGFYRSPLNRPEAGSVLNDNISTMLDFMGESFTIRMDEYIVRIAGKAGFTNVMERRSDRELNQNVQLSNELARNVILFESEELNNPDIKRLLRHPVDHVAAQTLRSLQEFESIPNELIRMLKDEILSTTEDPEVFAEALTVLVKNEMDISEYRSVLESMDAENEYLKHRMLPLFNEIETKKEYLDRLKAEIREGGIGGLRAVQALTNYYSENFQDDPEFIEEVRSMVRFTLEEGGRSTVSSLNRLLSSPKIFTEDDYDWMNEHYTHFYDNEQWEKAKVLEEILAARFPDRFDAIEIKEKPFRIPNWERLYEMGIQPHWVLETEQGTIEIRLDPLAAPFTVSSIDSLTRAGSYDGVPFHRVVHNFVIQGGDFDRRDGFGEPGYKLPTEPSFKSFERGMVGMASSGTDTEGSQYFIMLSWAPHLDSNYTIFGEVTKGMDVADRIQVGGRVLEARIFVR